MVLVVVVDVAVLVRALVAEPVLVVAVAALQIAAVVVEVIALVVVVSNVASKRSEIQVKFHRTGFFLITVYASVRITARPARRAQHRHLCGHPSQRLHP